jgi:hypothetical protein
MSECCRHDRPSVPMGLGPHVLRLPSLERAGLSSSVSLRETRVVAKLQYLRLVGQITPARKDWAVTS